MQEGGTSGKDAEDSDDDLFRVRSTAAAERPAHDLEAENAVDTAMLSMADLDLDRWQADGAMEGLRDRFVTGESSYICHKDLIKLGHACTSRCHLHCLQG